MAGESSISLGGIEERAAKLEEATKAAAQTPAEKPAEGAAPVENKTPASAEPAKPVATVPGQAPVTQPEKKEANDPVELRKAFTRTSMELSDVKKQLQALTDAYNKSAKKPVDWRELAKDPAKLQAAVEEQQKQLVAEHEEKYNKYHNDATARITRIENERRKYDPAYPRWTELQKEIVDLAVKADPRIDFSKDPADVLDQMYEIAQQIKPASATPAPAAAAPTVKTYTDADLAAAREEARKEALAEAQKGLANETKGAGVAGMGKGAPKGKPGVDKEALWNMPLKDLKSMIQKAS